MISRRDLVCLAIGAAVACYGMVLASFNIWALDSKIHYAVYNNVPRPLWWVFGATTDIRFGTFEDFSIESGPRNNEFESAIQAFSAEEKLPFEIETHTDPRGEPLTTYAAEMASGIRLEVRLRPTRVTFQTDSILPTTDETWAEAQKLMKEIYQFMDPRFPDHAISEVQINNERQRYSRPAKGSGN